MSLDAWLLSQSEVSCETVLALEESFSSTSCGLISSREKRKEINSVPTSEVLQRDDVISKRRKLEEIGNLYSLIFQSVFFFFFHFLKKLGRSGARWGKKYFMGMAKEKRKRKSVYDRSESAIKRKNE